MNDAVDLYETDFALWADTQARVLRDAQRAGVNVPVDWENVADEIESLSRTDRRAIRSRLRTIIEHLLKLQFSPATEPRRSWESAVARARDEAEDLLSESPSLRREISKMIDTVRSKAVGDAVDGLVDRGEPIASQMAAAHGGRFTDAEITGDWYPSAPL